MATRRMLSAKIVESDLFCDMPLTSQALYMHLVMAADDDGFINSARRVQRSCGASDDDLRVLISKGFLLVFSDGIVVVTHWRAMNTIKKDRYVATTYVEHMARLSLDASKKYCLDDGGEQLSLTGGVPQVPVSEQNQTSTCNGSILEPERNRKGGTESEPEWNRNDGTILEPARNHNGSKTEPQYRLGKDRLGKDRIDNPLILETQPNQNPQQPEILQVADRPTLDEVRAYAKAHDFIADPDSFFDENEKRGWVLDGERIRSWKKLFASWNRYAQSHPTQQCPYPVEKTGPVDLSIYDVECPICHRTKPWYLTGSTYLCPDCGEVEIKKVAT